MESKVVKKKFSMKEFLKDQKKSLPLKIVLLSLSGGAICIFPFLVLQMQSIGLTISEIAAMYLVIPIGSILGPLVSGLVADKTGRYKFVFVGTIVLGALSCNIFLIIPNYEQSKIYYSCDQGVMSIAYNDCNECIQTLIQKNQSLFDGESLTLKNCKPCVEDEYNSINCTEEIVDVYTCPVFSIDDILVDLTVQPSSSVCTIHVSNASRANMTYVESKKKCYKTKTCDYSCDIPENVQECFPKPLMSDTFIYTLLVSFAGHFFFHASFTMMDATILQVVQEQGLSVGKQKIMNMIGFSATPVLAGLLIDAHSKKVGYKSYFSVFMFSNALFACSCIFAYYVDIKVERNKSNIFKDLGKLVTTLEVNLFLLVCLILGCNFGFIESYVFIYLQSLGASSFLLGLTLTVGCLSSIPMLFMADWLEEKVGRHMIFFICFTAYATRMIGYSFIVNPWMCLIFESLESITYQLMWVICLKVCPLLAPKGLLATMTGLIGAVQYSFGKGIGGFVGGHLIDQFGMRNAFRIFAGVALAGGVFYLIIHYAYFKRIFEEKERELAEEREAEKESEEGKKMLPNGEKRPSENDISMDHPLSLLAVTGPGRKYSADGLLFYQTKRKESSERKPKENKTEQRNNSLNLPTHISKLRGSAPYLHDADLNTSLSYHDMKRWSKSENNLKT